MANPSRYTSSSLYSANPRLVGKRRPEDLDEDSSRQQQGDYEAGPLQGSSQPQQQSESPGSHRVIQLSASKRQLLNSGSISEEDRLALEREHRDKKYKLIFKREQQRRKWREEEDKKYEEKKARARRTAEENERRRKERADNLKDDHAKTNEDFLRRLEAGMRPPQSNSD